MTDRCWWCDKGNVDWRDVLGFWWHMACLDECDDLNREAL